MKTTLLGAATVAMLLAGAARADESANTLTLSSGPQRVSLLELYTSEGCSSCPPADRWMSKLKREPDLWRRFVPIAFHVDYWDYIGWKDRFSSANYSDRQRRYALQGGARAVYTPGFFRDGEEWRRWRNLSAPPSAGIDAGELQLQIGDNNVQVRFAPAQTGATSLNVHLAVIGMSLKTRVAAGENRGKTLRHDFVALGMTSVALKKDGAAWHAALTLPATSIEANDRAVVAWVTSGDRQAPLQSVGGPL